MQDKYTAVWVSHTSISDFLECPRAYFLKHVYRDPNTKHKIKLMTPPLALGQIVHEVLEGLSKTPTDSRFQTSLIETFDEKWEKVRGRKGGFFSDQAEQEYIQRGKDMLERVTKNPGPLTNLAVKIKMDLPHFWLSDEDNIILSGKIDWLEYIPETDSVHIIDFKTSKNDVDPNSLQLPIYHLLVHYCQQHPVSRASYWYLDREDGLVEKELPDIQTAHDHVLKIAKSIKIARQLERFKCPQGDNSCYNCRPFEAILRGEATLIGEGEYHEDIYIMDQSASNKDEPGSEIL